MEQEFTRRIAKIRSESLKATPEMSELMRNYAANVSVEIDLILERVRKLLASENVLEASVHAEVLSGELKLFVTICKTLDLY